jgi:hypothetical protein
MPYWHRLEKTLADKSQLSKFNPMNIASNKPPMKQRPVLRLKLGPAAPVTATVKVAEAAPSSSKTLPKLNPERAAAIAAEKAAASERVALRKAIQQRASKTMEALMERFPLCFGKPVPLKINIVPDIFDAAPDLDRHDVVNALDGYCNSTAYKAVLVKDAARIDLGGCPVGVVTAHHARCAAPRLG